MSNTFCSSRKINYIYKILNRRSPSVLQANRVWWVPVELDIKAMQEGAKYLLGNHDFTSFRAAACQAKSPIKTLDKLDIEKIGDEIIKEYPLVSAREVRKLTFLDVLERFFSSLVKNAKE